MTLKSTPGLLDIDQLHLRNYKEGEGIVMSKLEGSWLAIYRDPEFQWTASAESTQRLVEIHYVSVGIPKPDRTSPPRLGGWLFDKIDAK
jgi:hypothetical protein